MRTIDDTKYSPRMYKRVSIMVLEERLENVSLDMEFKVERNPFKLVPTR
jgi:hypothetical protein